MSVMQPQTKINELSAYMSEHSGLINPNDFRLHKFLKDARALCKVEPSIGYMMEGLVYRAQGMLEDSRAAIYNSFRLDRVAAGTNYVNILIHSGKFVDAEETILDMLSIDSTESYYLNCLSKTLLLTLNLSAAEKALEKFRSTSSLANKCLQDMRLHMMKASEIKQFLIEADISVDAYTHFCEIAEKTKNKNYFGNGSYKIELQRNELGIFLIVDEYLDNVSSEECFLVQDELIEAIIDDEAYPFDEYKKIIYSFRPTIDKASKEVVAE